MSLFKKIFNSESTPKEPQFEIPWIPLTDIKQLDELVELSKTKPVLIFKHSTRCGISSMTMRQFTGSYKYEAAQIQPYYLDLLSYRDLSNEIAIRFQVLHQSPQLIVIKNGSTVHAASHYEIQAASLERFI
ncbi:bacillithiol system redox-active protein YtxJ [Gilvibacter sp.]|uniref:bacillithiol system redox-active protein YtxJ n=1 Tax=Gilvibacter sp. TaxID=2729997 RepID=UPI003F4A5263